MENPSEFISKVKDRLSKTPQLYREFLYCLQRVLEHQGTSDAVIQQMQTILGAHPDLFHQFCQFLPKTKQESPESSKNSMKFTKKTSSPPIGGATLIPKVQPNLTVEGVQAYIDSIKQRYKDRPQVYEDFLAMLRGYQSKPGIPFEYVQNKLAKLFSEAPDLIRGFSNFMRPSHAEKLLNMAKTMEEQVKKKRKHPMTSPIIPGTTNAAAAATSDVVTSSDGYPSKRLRSSKRSDNNNKKLQKIEPVMATLSPSPVVAMVVPVDSARLGGGGVTPPRVGVDEPDFDLSRLDLDSLERVDISYVVLPPEAKDLQCSGRDSLCNEVLNNSLMITPPPNVQHYNTSDPNPYARISFLVENDQYELDLLIERSNSTISMLEDLIKTKEKIANTSLNLDNYLSAVHKKCIQSLYGRAGKDKLSLLLSSPKDMAEDILEFLKEKKIELFKCKNRWNSTWRSVHRKVALLAMDDYGEEFKELDIENRRPSALLMEIKEAHYWKKAKHQGKEQEYLENQGQSQGLQLEQNQGLFLGLGHQEQELNEGHLIHLGHDMSLKMYDTDIIGDVVELMEVVADMVLELQIQSHVKHFIRKFSTVFFQKQLLFEAKQNANGKSDSYSPYNSFVKKTDDLDSTDISDFTKLAKNRIFFGDFGFYVFFRLFQLLYFRLSKAKYSGIPSPNWDWNKCQPPKPKETTISDFKEFDSLIQNPVPTDPEHVIPEELYRDPLKKYAALLADIRELLLGNVSCKYYEEHCMRLFGPTSYFLFGVDHLILQLTKQVKLLLSHKISTTFILSYEGFLLSYLDPKDAEIKYLEQSMQIMHQPSVANEYAKYLFRFQFHENCLGISLQNQTTWEGNT